MKVIIAILAVLAASKNTEVHSVPLELSSLHDDLEDFMKLVPKNEIKDLFYQYLSQDDDFGEAVDYLTSNEFKSVWNEFFSIKEVQDFVNYLQSTGLDAKGFIERIKHLLGFDDRRMSYFPVYGMPKISGGLPGFLKDVKALIPVVAVQELYEEKLVNSKDFAAFIDKLKSEEFHQVVNKVVSNPKVQEFVKRARAKGVDFNAIIDFLKTLFPFHKFQIELRHTLKDDFDEFMSLAPLDEIEHMCYIYVNDPEDLEMQEVMAYFRSDIFKSLSMEIASIQDVQEFINYLESTGLKVRDFVEKVRKFMKIDDFETSKFQSGSLGYTQGLKGFFMDLEALFPILEWEELYIEKVKSSKSLSEFMAKLRSPDFQTLVDKVFGNMKFQDMLHRAEAKNVDIQKALHFLSSFLGIHFPMRSTLA
ncbi:hypothetical protein QAD02_023719 [Eretmocerus hayati]|uniref:Uncharacterized protein n=1 Tax=Eretmocerus hayati TaxID=131215 RepID=A0ACC2PWE1_9HYME|nr:hypothetical protein QAD02_023719 [Eretmocerus hayati]